MARETRRKTIDAKCENLVPKMTGDQTSGLERPEPTVIPYTFLQIRIDGGKEFQMLLLPVGRLLEVLHCQVPPLFPAITTTQQFPPIVICPPVPSRLLTSNWIRSMEIMSTTTLVYISMVVSLTILFGNSTMSVLLRTLPVITLSPRVLWGTDF